MTSHIQMPGTTSPAPQNPLSLAPTQQPIPSSSIHNQSTAESQYQQQYQQSAPTGPQQHTAMETYPHQASGSGGPTATAPFLRDFSLVAEAAKRAQMSVVMRDLEAVTL
ncbi:hypothetical protein BDV28DRAFT_135864 [Aspergillus coremiiformis]|uniref:Uncharacterized protein n=1 Tax=Aspergillus coremiiformis TaxID=138285 RepID=A0A5N6Z315_9EURO|nr:hypothetical protein BDV28DRAFT_135864 [Aspergillus coremiiformis]